MMNTAILKEEKEKEISKEERKRENLEERFITKCPDCGSTNIITDVQRGEKVCSECGLVIADHAISLEQERRAFTAAEREKRVRTGAPITNLLPDMGLTTVIDRPRADNHRLRRAVKWQNRLPWSKRNILIATSEIKRIGGTLNLPQDVKETAAMIYRKAFNKKLLRGRSIKAMVAASVYYACRASRIPRTMQEIIEQSGVDGREMRKAYRTLVKELGLRVPALSPSSLVPKYISELGLSNKVENRVISILRKIEKQQFIAGKDPKGLCAAAIYIAAKEMGESRSQQEISKVVGITEVTLRSRARAIKEFLEKATNT